MKALVLGGNGFIGGRIVAELAAQGIAVRSLDRTAVTSAHLPPGCEYVAADFLDPGALLEAMQGIDIVFHCISTTVPSTSNMDPVFDIETNLVGTVQLLQAMIKCSIRRIVFISSGGTVYGIPKIIPTPEDHPVAPLCSYGIIKHAIERYLSMYESLEGLRPLIVRAANPYGIGQGHLGVQGAVNTFLKQALQQQEIVVWGDGTVSRDYFYVDDLATFCVIAGQSQHTGIYNVGSGQAISVDALIAQIEEVTGLPAKVRHVQKRAFDLPENLLDIAKAQHDFDWRPEVTLTEGLRRCVAHLKNSTQEGILHGHQLGRKPLP